MNRGLGKSHLLNQVPANAFDQLLSLERRRGFNQTHGQARLMLIGGKIGINQRFLHGRGHVLPEESQFIVLRHPAVVQLLKNLHAGGERKYLSHFRQGLKIIMDGLKLRQSIPVEPGGGHVGLLLSAEGIIKRIVRFLSLFRRGRRRVLGVDHDVQRNRPAQFRIDQFHAPINFRGAFEMIDKAVFHFQLHHPRAAQRGQRQTPRDDRLHVLERESGYRHGERPGCIRTHDGFFRLEQRQDRREIDEVQHEREGNPHRHHPAEINHGPDVTDDQGTKGHDGRHGRIQAGLGHLLHGLRDQRVLVRLRVFSGENAVTHD